MEWLGHPNNTPASAISDTSDPFEQVGRKEMHDQRKEWEYIAFTENENGKTQVPAIDAYLDKVFSSTSKSKKLLKSPLETLRESMNKFKLRNLTSDSLKSAMKGILITDLLSESKRKALVDFQNNPLILQEIVDVLNMQIDAIDTWSWGEDAVPVIVKRALNGKYRVYMDEELIQAILIHHVGMSWAVHFKSSFTTFFHSGAWKQSSRKPLTAAARRLRRDFGLDDKDERTPANDIRPLMLSRWDAKDDRRQASNIRNERRDRYHNEYFMVQLPDEYENTSDEYDESDNSKTKSPMAIKQSLLHLVSAEAVLQTRLHNSFALLQSDFRWFGPSLPHITILTVLRFLGVRPFWLGFFKKFLKAPLKFVQDGPDAEVRIRKCGVPIQHRLSDALGEAVLFCLDFAVNKATECNLYRMHDDIWFWGSRTATETAWETLNEFAGIMGLTLNDGKTGSVEITGSVAKDSRSASKLPPGEISWGFMKMQPSGSWALDESQVDMHVQEVQTQLKACKSILAWVQAWNVYVTRFLANNFGEPANCLGRSHIEMTVAAFKTIQKGVFAADGLPGENVLDHLRTKLAERFGVTDIPDGFFYFPIELGGLGLRNPFVKMLLVRENVEKRPVDLIERAFELEEVDYSKAKKSYEDGTSRSRFDRISTNVDSFMSFEEYVAYAEETSSHLAKAYIKLLEEPSKRQAKQTISDDNYEGVTGDGGNWTMELYGKKIIDRYGGMAMGEKILLPIGLVTMLKGEKISWQG